MGGVTFMAAPPLQCSLSQEAVTKWEGFSVKGVLVGSYRWEPWHLCFY